MIPRHEFKNSGEGAQAAIDYRKKNGGTVVFQERNQFGAWWLEAIYWYSPDYRLFEIDKDLSRPWPHRAFIDEYDKPFPSNKGA